MIIALCGFMTAGKTLAGKALAEKTGMRLIDLDQYIEQKEGLDMESIFREKGEEYFRMAEEASLKEIIDRTSPKETIDDAFPKETIANASLKETSIILSLGGGTPMNPACRALLKERTKCFFLTCSPKVLAERMLLLQNGRPLVKALLAEHPNSSPAEQLLLLETWATQKLQERLPLYQACSIKTIDTSNWDVDSITAQILSNIY